MNRSVLAGLGATWLALVLFAPSSIGRFAPLLVALACPLSMVFMMRRMNGGQCERPSRDEVTPSGRRQQPSVGTAEAEILRLRAEVDQLRAELAGKDAVPPAGSEPTVVPFDQPR